MEFLLLKLNKCEILLDNVNINRTNEAKFLGVIIDEHLSWKSHITYIKGKIAKNIGIMNRLKFLLSEKTLLSLYSMLVLPYLNYCNIIWASNKPSRINPLLLLQKRLVRIITNSSYIAHSKPLFFKLNQLTIFDINKLLIATFMFRYHTNCLPDVFSGYFCTNSSIHEHFTRTSKRLHISYARTNIMKSQIRICGPTLWNSIDPALVDSCTSWRGFKCRYKKILLTQYN